MLQPHLLKASCIGLKTYLSRRESSLDRVELSWTNYWASKNSDNQPSNPYASTTPCESVWYAFENVFELSWSFFEPCWTVLSKQKQWFDFRHPFNTKLSAYILQQHLLKASCCVWRRIWLVLKRLWIVLNRIEGVLEQSKIVIWQTYIPLTKTCQSICFNNTVRKRLVCIWKRTWADLKRLWTLLNCSEGVLEQAKTMRWLHTSLINRVWAVLKRVWIVLDRIERVLEQEKTVIWLHTLFKK